MKSPSFQAHLYLKQLVQFASSFGISGNSLVEEKFQLNCRSLFGFSLKKSPSTLGPFAGDGVFVRGTIQANQVITFYPGIIYPSLTSKYSESESLDRCNEEEEDVILERFCLPNVTITPDLSCSTFDESKSFKISLLHQWFLRREMIADGNTYILYHPASKVMLDGRAFGRSAELFSELRERAAKVGIFADDSWIDKSSLLESNRLHHASESSPYSRIYNPLAMGSFINHQSAPRSNCKWDLVTTSMHTSCPSTLSDTNISQMQLLIPSLDLMQVTYQQFHLLSDFDQSKQLLPDSSSQLLNQINHRRVNRGLMTIIATREITDGEELFLDYQEDPIALGSY